MTKQLDAKATRYLSIALARLRLSQERHDLGVMTEDVVQPLLGLSAADAELLCSRAQIAFHSAAAIAFNHLLSTTIRRAAHGACQALQAGEATADVRSISAIHQERYPLVQCRQLTRLPGLDGVVGACRGCCGRPGLAASATCLVCK